MTKLQHSLRPILLLLAAAMAGVNAAPAMAETLPVAGIYPAGNDAAAEVTTIAIEPFGGERGTSLSFAIEDALRDVVVDGERWFEIVPVSGGAIAPDAVMRGTVAIERQTSRAADRKKTECVKRDDKDKCIQEDEVVYRCRTLTVYFRPEVRLIAATGEMIARLDAPSQRAETYCADDKERPSEDAMTREMIDGFARNARFELAPHYRDEGIRVLEIRDGLRKEDRRALKDAIRLTKKDIGGACRAFAALEADNPQAPSVLFNIGLCAEGQGDLEKAERYYRKADQVDIRKPHVRQGLSRLAERRRADQQLAVHFGE